MSDSYFDTIMMDNRHDPPKMMMVSGQLFILMLTVQFMYKVVLWCTIDILYILIEHKMYLILIINQNLILSDHENKK